MDRDPRQQFRLALLVLGWGMVGVNLALDYLPGALLLALPMSWATWVYFKRRKDSE